LVVLLTSALFISISIISVPKPVLAGPSLAVSPTSGPHGLVVAVYGSGFNLSDTSTTLNFDGGAGSGFLFVGDNHPTLSPSGSYKIATGSFTVATAATPGVAYTLNLTGSPSGDSAITTFTVAARDPGITLTPISGAQGAVVAVAWNGTTGAEFSTADVGICTMSSIPTGLISSYVCQINSSGVLVTPISGFVVSTAPGGSYLVTVTGKLGDSASAVFTVTAGLTLTPDSGSPAAGSQVATEVTATGKGFRPGGPGGCTITPTTPSGGTSGVLNIDTIGEPACTVTSGGVLTAKFRVGTGSVWTTSGYNVTVKGPLGDSASANFNVVPTIVLSPTSGSIGTLVNIVGSGFNGTAGSCSITGGAVPPFLGVPSCTQFADGTIVTAFNVNNTAAPPGSYIITVKDAKGYPYAYKPFSLGTGPTITLSPSVVQGTVKTVTVTGSGWHTLDTSVSFNVTALSDPPYTRTCSVSGGSLASGCSFIVRLNARGGSYVIRFNGTQGDWTTAQFIVSSTLILSPASGPAGTFVTMSGSGYAADSSDCSGSVSAFPALSASLPAPLKCRIVNYVLSGNFTVALFTPATSYGTHTVTMTNLTLVQQGSVSANTFTVIAPTISLSPTSGPRGILVTVSGINFNLNDTTCTVIPTTCNTLGCSSCLVTSPGIISGIYAVNGTAGSQLVVARGYGPPGTTNFDNATATFTIQAAITMLPTSGRAGTSVILTGMNFASADIGCTITSSPSGLVTSSVCTLAGGSMSGAFIVASGTNGSYTVIVTGTTSDTGRASFNVPASPTLHLSPVSGPVGTGVVASGSNYLGTTCLITAVPSSLFASSSCSLSGGTLAGGFTVASGATTGSYTVTVQTSAGAGDSATASFTVGVTTTTAVTTPTTTVTLPTTTTLTTALTTTTSTASSVTTSVSATTTTAITTGPWTPPKPCIIATATFGSEVSSAVQFLRNFRDGLVLSTKAGSAFMEVFNAWYYSFSPSVAGFIAGNDPLRAPVRVLLYPLLGILGVSTLAYSMLSGVPELAVVVTGLVASSLIGLVYLTIPVLVAMRAFLKRRRFRITGLAKGAAALLAVALALLAAGEVAESFLLLAVGGSVVVLTCLVAAPIVAALAMLGSHQE
jgi:hypothetical protein